MNISVVLPTYDEGRNIEDLINRVRDVLVAKGIDHEVIVVDAGSSDDTRENAERVGAKVLVQQESGYGMALKEGFEIARGDRILTMDADLSHDPSFIGAMIDESRRAEIIIASRYVEGGSADMSRCREMLSLTLNKVYCLILALPFKDISSGFRLYDRRAIEDLEITSRNFDVLEEILIKAYVRGMRIVEVPFHYKPRIHGKSHAKLIQFGISYLKTLARMWWLRFRR